MAAMMVGGASGVLVPGVVTPSGSPVSVTGKVCAVAGASALTPSGLNRGTTATAIGLAAEAATGADAVQARTVIAGRGMTGGALGVHVRTAAPSTSASPSRRFHQTWRPRASRPPLAGSCAAWAG